MLCFRCVLMYIRKRRVFECAFFIRYNHLRQFILWNILFLNSIGFAQSFDFSIAPKLFFFDYKETSSDNRVLDRESGDITGVDLKMEYLFVDRISFFSELTLASGGVDYDGQTQSGNSLETQTLQQWRSLSLGIQYQLTFNMMLSSALLRYEWERDIQSNNSTIGLFEFYRWNEIELSFKHHFLNYRQSTLWYQIGTMRTHDLTVSVNLDILNLSNVHLPLGNHWGEKVSIGWQKESIDKTYYWGVSFTLQQWNFGKSDEKMVSNGRNLFTISEPESQSHHRMLRVFIAKYF